MTALPPLSRGQAHAGRLAERRQAWATSLRLHRYRRTHGALRRYDAFSVLGIAEHVYAEHVGASARRWQRGPHGYYAVVGDDARLCTVDLTPECAVWFGLTETDPYVRHAIARIGRIKLSTLDASGRTADQLATLIESLPADWRGNW